MIFKEASPILYGDTIYYTFSNESNYLIERKLRYDGCGTYMTNLPIKAPLACCVIIAQGFTQEEKKDALHLYELIDGDNYSTSNLFIVPKSWVKIKLRRHMNRRFRGIMGGEASGGQSL